MKNRCNWANPKNQKYLDYHDKEWGRPLKDSLSLFEMLCLEGAQAGLSWETILNKREGYRAAFFHFDPQKMAKMTPKQMERLMQNPEIIRNRLKINAFKENAKSYLAMKEDFSKFLWSFVDHKPIVNHFKTLKDIPAQTKESEAMSKALKKLGFKFVGPTICYAFMQAVGMVNDHIETCYLYGRKLK